MAVPFSNTKLRVPRGFRNILEGFSREILRSQPSDIYAFGSLYFEKLLQIRAESGFDPSELGAQEEDRFYNDKSYAKGAARRESSLDEEMAALKIQTKYRQYTAKKVLRGLKEEKAAVKIQSVFRGHRDRKRVQSIKDATEIINVARLEMARLEDEEEEEREGDSPSKIIIADFPDKKGIDKSELPKEMEEKKEEEEDQEDDDEIMSHREEAATRIQAGMRGLLLRKTLKEQQLIPSDQTESEPEKQQQDEKELEQKKAEKMEEDEEEEEEEEEEEVISDLEDAATRIQAGMRGLLLRKTLKGQLIPDAQTDEDEKDRQKEDGDKEESGTKEDGDKEESGTKEDGEKGESGTKDASEENDAEKKE